MNPLAAGECGAGGPVPPPPPPPPPPPIETSASPDYIAESNISNPQTWGRSITIQNRVDYLVCQIYYYEKPPGTSASISNSLVYLEASNDAYEVKGIAVSILCSDSNGTVESPIYDLESGN